MAQKTDDASGATAENICESTPLTLRLFLHSVKINVYMSKCVYILCECVLRSELCSTLRYIGKPEKFPSLWGGNLEKRAQVPTELQGTDHTPLESTLCPHLPVITLTTPLETQHSPPHCKYTKLISI